jgi:hypothetical protein
MSSNWPKGIQFLLNSGGLSIINKPEKFGRVPLAYAVIHQNIDVVELLLQAGCCIPIGNSTGRVKDVFQVACEFGTKPIIQMVIHGLTTRRLALKAFASLALPSLTFANMDAGEHGILDEEAPAILKVLCEHNIQVPDEVIFIRMVPFIIFPTSTQASLKISSTKDSPILKGSREKKLP